MSNHYSLEQMELETVEAPDDTVRPGRPVTVDVTLRNHAAFINSWNADKCGSGFDYLGYKCRTVVDHPNGEKDSTRCVGTAAVGTNRVTESLSFTAPSSEGEHALDVHLELPGSGKTTATKTTYITVSSSSSTRPDDDDDDGGSGSWTPPWAGDSGDGDGDDSSLSFPDLSPDLGLEDLDMLLLIGLVLLAMVAAGQLFDINLGGSGS
jgi:hypothetical protein